MKIFIGSDHAGFKTKEAIKKFLINNKYDFEDLGTDSPNVVDYPDIAKAVSKKTAKTKDSKGILICGSGTGMTIAANKVKGIRAALCYDEYSAKMSRQDNDCNILGLRSRGFSDLRNKKIVKTWIYTKFSNKARHKKRIEKIKEIEK